MDLRPLQAPHRAPLTAEYLEQLLSVRNRSSAGRIGRGRSWDDRLLGLHRRRVRPWGFRQPGSRQYIAPV